jgi:hypothetical protein
MSHGVSYLAKLLQASITLKQQEQRIQHLEAENAQMKRQLDKARLWADMRAQAAEFEVSADSTPALLRPQA